MADTDKALQELEDLFAAARAEPPAVPDQLTAAILEDAARVQPGLQAAAPARRARLPLWRQLTEAIGGWPALGGLAAVALLATQLDSTSDAWAGLPPAILVSALVGQAIWSVRFPLQWLLSERAGRTHFPLAFWWLSLAGAGCNLAYTGWLGEPKYIVGYVLAWLVPLRNLALEYRRRASAPRSAEEPTRRSP